MTTVSDERIKEELDKVKQAVSEVTGRTEMTFLRPPRGIFNDRTLSVTRQYGYTNVFWSVAYKDWDVNDQKGADYAFRKVTSQLHPGAVLLIHAISKDNTDALASIIDEARRQGYTFKSLKDLPGQQKTPLGPKPSTEPKLPAEPNPGQGSVPGK
ncbi:Peptidoglycan-N-acetylmuramic acid deacetylase PdaA precursor [compost metagenome]